MCAQNIVKTLITGLLSATLSACGGGGGSDGKTDPEATTSTTTVPVRVVEGPVKNPTKDPVSVLHGSDGGDVELLAGYVGTWVSACVPYPMTQMAGDATIHQFQLTSFEAGYKIFAGISHFRQFSDSECMQQVGETIYQIAAQLKDTVLMSNGSSIAGYADRYELTLQAENGETFTLPYLVGIYDDNHLRIGEGDTWFDLTKPSAVYTRH